MAEDSFLMRELKKAYDFADLAFYFGLAFGVLGVLLIMLLTGTHFARAQSIDELMVPPTAAEAKDIENWIPQVCCRTAGCCRKVQPTALHPLNRDLYQVVASGQLIYRTGWSRDGQTWRCACDHQPDGTWLVHLRANTRCIFPAMQGY
jgi:hypothetical protein